MDEQHRGTEWKVGLFILIGLAVTAVMAVKFGKLGQGFEKFYRVTVEFPNASGLLKGADVYLAGAKVGMVEDAPSLLPDKWAVKVPLKIRQQVKIPRTSAITIRSAGFIGDSFVNINPPQTPDDTDVLAPDAYVIGTRIEGFDELTAKSGDTIEELKKRMEELKVTIAKVNDDVLSDTNTKNLGAAFADIKDTAANLKGASKGLDEVIAKGKDAVQSAKETFDSTKTAATKLDTMFEKANTVFAKLDTAVDDIKKFAATAGKTFDSVRTLVNKANQGQGALGVLLNDRETADNLKALIQNLKTRGVLFYKDKAK